MAKPNKVTAVSEIAEKFRSSGAAVVTEYRGLKVQELTALRRALGSDTAYTVAKNTLVRRAAVDAGVEGLDELLTGPTAIAFVSGEVVDAAKALRDFAKTHQMLLIKGGLMDGKVLNAADVLKLADLESRDTLLAKLAGALVGKPSQAASMFNQLPTQAARLFAALKDLKAEGEPAAAAPQGADDLAQAPAEATAEA